MAARRDNAAPRRDCCTWNAVPRAAAQRSKKDILMMMMMMKLELYEKWQSNVMMYGTPKAYI